MFCILVVLTCVIVSTTLVQGRSLRRRHGHHALSDYLEKSLPRDLSERLEDDLEYYPDFYGQAKKRKHAQLLDHSEYEEYEDLEERVPPFLLRYEHEDGSRGRESLRRKEDFLLKHDDFDAFSRIVARRKRNNKHGGMRNQDKRNLQHRRNFLEMEVKMAQNRSICNYTVESVPDLYGSRIPRNLEHVRCNHLGSSCQGTNSYCCIQTYKNIEVSYGNGHNETMKLYVGCVCASNSHSLIQSLARLDD